VDQHGQQVKAAHTFDGCWNLIIFIKICPLKNLSSIKQPSDFIVVIVIYQHHHQQQQKHHNHNEQQTFMLIFVRQKRTVLNL